MGSTPNHLKPETVEKILLACVCLHKKLIREQGNSYIPPGNTVLWTAEEKKQYFLIIIDRFTHAAMPGWKMADKILTRITLDMESLGVSISFKNCS